MSPGYEPMDLEDEAATNLITYTYAGRYTIQFVSANADSAQFLVTFK